MRLRIAVFLLFSLLLGGLQLPPAHASLSSTLQWEIRTTGASSNGGAFRTGATGGTDYSQQNSAQFTYTDLAATSIAAPAAGPTVNSSTTGGSIPNGTWYVVVTYVVDGGETTASPQTSITISSGTGTNKITVSSPSGVTGVPRYRVYIGTVSGGPYYFQTDSERSIGLSYDRFVTPTNSGTTSPGSNTALCNVTSAAQPFTGAANGNLLNITGGTNWSTGRAEVLVVNGSAATLSRAVATAVGATGGQGKLGGALVDGSILNAADGPVAGNLVWVKSGTYSLTSAWPLGNSGTPLNAICLVGYGSTRGDGTKPLLQYSSGTIPMLDISGRGWSIQNFEINGNSGANVQEGLKITGGECQVVNVYVHGCAKNVTLGDGGCKLRQCWLASPKTGTTNLEVNFHPSMGNLETNGCLVELCAINGSSVAGVTLVKGTPVLKYNLIYGNQDGILADNNTYGCFCVSNTIWGNSRDGIRFGADGGNKGLLAGWTIEHNVFGQNTSYNIRSAVVDLSGQTEWAKAAGLKNAFYTTGTGSLSMFPALPDSLTLANNPYTNPAAGDFSRSANFGPLAGAATTTLPDGNNSVETLGAIW